MSGTSEVPQLADPLCATRKSAEVGQRRTKTKATANLNRTVLNRSLQLTFSTASGVHSHFCAASFAT